MLPDPHLEVAEMQREWRSSVAASIKSTEAKVDLLLSQMTEMRVEYVRASQLESLTKRVVGLENDKHRIIGAAVVLNLIGGLVLFFISKIWK